MSITRKKKQNGLFYTKAEERINTLSHAAGILMGIIVGTIFLVKSYQSGNFWAVSGSIFSACSALTSPLPFTMR